MLFRACFYLLIFCLDDLSTDISEVLRSPTIIVLLSVSSVVSVTFAFYIKVLLSSVHTYISSWTDPLIIKFHSFLWLGSIPLHIYTVSSLSIHLLIDT